MHKIFNGRNQLEVLLMNHNTNHLGYDSTSAIGGTLNLGAIQLTSNGYNDIFIAKIAPSLMPINNLQVRQNALEIFPNPFHNKASFYFNNPFHSNNAKLIIYDILGKQIKSINLISGNNLISRKDMDNGIFFYKVSNNGAVTSTGKFILQ